MGNFKNISLSIALLTTLNFTGCGGGSSSTSNDNSSVKGKVADGYLDNAKVCLDKNENGKCDSDEPSILSKNGSYNLNISKSDQDKYPILVEVITSTVDLDDNNNVVNGYTLTAPKDSTEFISPITTLIQHEIEKCPALTKDEATNKVSKKLNLTSTDTKLLTDYVTNNSDSELSKLHEVGKVVAKLQGELESKLTQSAIMTDENKKASVSQILDNIYSDINNTSSQIANGTLSSAIDTTTKVNNTNITDSDIAVATKSIELIKTNTTVKMENILTIPMFTFKHGKINGWKFIIPQEKQTIFKKV